MRSGSTCSVLVNNEQACQLGFTRATKENPALRHTGTEREREGELKGEGEISLSHSYLLLSLALSISISIWWSTCGCKHRYYYKTVARLRAARRWRGCKIGLARHRTIQHSICRPVTRRRRPVASSTGPVLLVPGWWLAPGAVLQRAISLFVSGSFSFLFFCFFEALAQIWEDKILPVTLVLADAVTWFLFSWAGGAADPCLYAKRWFVNMKQCVNS